MEVYFEILTSLVTAEFSGIEITPQDSKNFFSRERLSYYNVIELLFIGIWSALLVSARIYDFSRTVQDIVKVVRIGEGTIKKRFYLLISIY